MSIRSAWSAAWSTLGSWLGAGQAYSATDPRRKTSDPRWIARNGTANEALALTLPQLRAKSRDLERNNPTARAIVDGQVANIVGTGIALEPDTGDEAVDEKIRPHWIQYLEDCTAGGKHDGYYLQSQAFREVVTAGEFVWRFVMLPERLDAGKIPLCVLPLEAEWLDDQANTVGRPDERGLVWVGGVAVDKYGRPQAYRLRSPESRGAQAETLAAGEIVHGFEHRRSLQARGEPWLAPVIETLQQEQDLITAELTAAKTTASIALAITSEMHDGLDTTVYGDPDDPRQVLKLGSTVRLHPGEDAKAFSHTRPSQQIAPFRQMLRGDIAAATRISQRFLDRDVSRANYSSMRADMLDAERLSAPTREWFGHASLGRLYVAVLPFLAVKAGVRMPKPTYRLLPEGQPYVNPVDDIKAALMAIAGGLSTYEQEIAKRGGDLKKVWDQKKKEKSEQESLGLEFDMTGKGTPSEQEAAAAPAAKAGGFDG